ncbi:GH92 family glycosyl hydrolase [Streptomyces sp. PU-14G]|uniref:GH92 family glycosyl hydrolase n=1 Tax=Streptomyces sp. PU-14G TaxID=2800808 RepID=UPI0034DF3911
MPPSPHAGPPRRRGRDTSRARSRWAAATLGCLLPLVGLSPLPASAATSARPDDDPASLVDVFTGTAPSSQKIEQGMGENFSKGNTHPAATAPFGMLQWGPDTAKQTPGLYHSEDDELTGFSLTHLSGGGCTAFGDVPFQPVPGTVHRSPAAHPDAYTTAFDHADEDAAPGTYHVRAGNGVDTRLAAGTRAGAGRFTFPQGHGGRGTVLLDTSGSANGVSRARVRVHDDRRTVTGTVTSGGICSAKAPYTLSFRAEFDRPYTAHGTWSGKRVHAGSSSADGTKNGAYLTFGTKEDRSVGVRVSLSYTDADGARRNLAEARGQTVGGLARRTHEAWNRELSRIRVAGGSAARVRTFYTALYHSLLEPRTLSDTDGRYRGFDRKIHRVADGRTWYGNFSGWDVYRTQTPLLAFLDPRRASDMAQSMVDAADQSGWLPRWTLLHNHSNGMVGDPAPAMLAATHAFGARDFDVRGALRYSLQAATKPTPPREDGYVERQALREWKQNGFLRHGDSPLGSAAATSLEYAVDDFGVARLAAATGDERTRRTFMRRAHNWQNLLDGADGRLKPRMADGALAPQSNPASLAGFQEGSGGQYQWMTGQDLSALAAGMGGQRQAADRLDTHFTQVDAGSNTPHAWIGNEITFGAPWAYHAFGAPNRAGDVIPRMRDLFTTGPAGLPGNDDLGALSAWYVWASIGMYPETPGSSRLALSTPAFDSVTVERGRGRTLRITAPGAGTGARYIEGVTLDGSPHTRNWTTAGALSGKASALHYRLTDDRHTRWGTAAADRYPSYAEGRFPAVASATRAAARPGGTTSTKLTLTPADGRPVRARWKLDAPEGVHLDRASGTVSGSRPARVRVTVEKDTAPGQFILPLRLTTTSGRALPPGAVRLAVTPRHGTCVLPWADEAGISTRDRPVGDLNGYGGSYVAEELAEDGLVPGRETTVEGIRYRWPAARPGQPDHVNAHGQTLTVDGHRGARRLGILGAGNEGASSGTLTVHYTDGTTSRGRVRLGDWHLDGATEPPPHNTAAATMPTRQMPSGTPEKMTTYVWATDIPLDPDRTVASVTLPTAPEGGQLHVFAVGQD